MGFWIFCFFMVSLIPMTMVLLGKRYSSKPPKKINLISGYRTTMSMKNQETWVFANKLMGKIWFKVGLVLLPISDLPMLFVIGKDKDTIATVLTVFTLVQVACMLISIIPIEKELRKNFDKEGNRL